MQFDSAQEQRLQS